METHFFDFNSVIGKEVVDCKVAESSLKRRVVPQDLERQHFPVIIKVLLQAIIGMSASQFHLNVLLVLLCIWRIDLCVLGADKSLEEVVGLALGLIERHFHIAVKLLSEGITVIDPEDPLEEVDVDGDIEIFPSVVICQLSDDLWDLLPLDEDSLRNARIFNLRLSDKDGLIREIVVDKHRSDPIILQSALDDMLLEICIEPQHLPIIFKPRWLNARNVVILRRASLLGE